MGNKLKRIYKEAAVAYFKVLSRDLPGVNEEITKNLSQDS